MKKIIFIFLGLFLLNSFAFADVADQCKDGSPNATSAECVKVRCENLHSEWSKLKKQATREALETAKESKKDEIAASKDKTTKKSELQEKIAEAEKAAQDAEVEYGKTKKELQDALDEFEKSANEQGQELVKEIQTLISKLEKNLTVDRDELNTEYQNSLMQGFEACKQSAEQLFMSKLGLIRDANKKQNSGYSFSGGVSLAKPSKIKKARAEAKKAHATCVAETKRVLEAKRSAALQKLALEEKRLNQELTAKQQELDRITNSEYKKKLNSLEQALLDAQKTMIAAQEKAKKDIARLQEELSASMLDSDTEIATHSALANVKEGFSEEEEDAREEAKEECCSEKAPKAGAGVPKSFCSESQKSKTSKGKSKGAS